MDELDRLPAIIPLVNVARRSLEHLFFAELFPPQKFQDLICDLFRHDEAISELKSRRVT